MARANYVGLVAESVRERLKINGFRVGDPAESDSGEALADENVGRLWVQNRMDADAGLVHQAAIVMSRAYVTVTQDPKNEHEALICAEDPRAVITEADPLYRRRIAAALGFLVDEVTGMVLATVYLPEATYFFRSTVPYRTDDLTEDVERLWSGEVWRIDESAFAPDGVIPNQLGVVPVVPFINRPMLGGHGLGEFEDVLDIQDRINTTLLDRMVISALQAFRQRWAKGIELEDENGQPLEPFDPGADILWAVPDEKAAFGDFQQSDLTPILKAIDDDIRQLSSVTRTPPHYLLGEMINVSGDALKAAETGLVAKVRERQRHFGESWEQVIRLALLTTGKLAPSDVVNVETLWADPESRTMAELADAAVKKQAVGVPWRQNMVDLGYTPVQIARMETERAEQALLNLVDNEPQVTPGG